MLAVSIPVLNQSVYDNSNCLNQYIINQELKERKTDVDSKLKNSSGMETGEESRRISSVSYLGYPLSAAGLSFNSLIFSKTTLV